VHNVKRKTIREKGSNEVQLAKYASDRLAKYVDKKYCTTEPI